MDIRVIYQIFHFVIAVTEMILLILLKLFNYICSGCMKYATALIVVYYLVL